MRTALALTALTLATVTLVPAALADDAEARSQQARAKPSVDEEGLQEFSARNLAFACDLYRLLSAGDDDLCFSPTSIAQALGMLQGGARGDTAAELAKALHFDDGVHADLNALAQALASRGRGAKGKDGQPFRLRVVNQAWGQSGFHFQQPYLDLLAEDYGAGIRLLDFRAQPEPSRATINGWVAKQTEDRIPELIPQGTITPDTRLVLTNAVYFNASWAEQFKKERTAPRPFHLRGGETVTLPFMNQTEGFPFAEGEGWKLVELPYDGRELSMLVLVPDDLAAFEAGLDGEHLQAILDRARRTTRLQLALPSFKFRSKLDLTQRLQELGVKQAFSPSQADFSGITGDRDLFVSAVLHETFVDVDEEGTEAAAATAVVMRATGMPAPPRPLVVDRPFLFLIRDGKSGAVVFLGRVGDPRG